MLEKAEKLLDRTFRARVPRITDPLNTMTTPQLPGEQA